MIARIFGDRRAEAVLRRIDRPEAILVAVLLAALGAVGWISAPAPMPLAIVVALELAIGGAATVRLIGPARPGLGVARYMTLALAAVSLTLFGRVLPAGVSILLVPFAAVLLWSVLWLELRSARGIGSQTMLDLALVAILFAGAAGLYRLFGEITWPPTLILIGILTFLLALRAADARGDGGATGFGQAILHLLAVLQVAAALALLSLPGVVAPAILALAFHAWIGAADALEHGGSARSVAVEFGSLAGLGVLVALLLHRP